MARDLIACQQLRPAARAGRPRGRTFAALRQAILSGDVAPGRRLVEEDLASDARGNPAVAARRAARPHRRGARRAGPQQGRAGPRRHRRRGGGDHRVPDGARGAVRGQGGPAHHRRGGRRSCASSARTSSARSPTATRSGTPSSTGNCTAGSARSPGSTSRSACSTGCTRQLVRHQFQLALRPGRPEVSLAEHLAILEAVADRRPARRQPGRPRPPGQRHRGAAGRATSRISQPRAGCRA